MDSASFVQLSAPVTVLRTPTSTATCEPENHASKRLRGQGFLCQARRIDTEHVEIPYYSQLRNAISFASTDFPQVFHINDTKNF